MNKTISHSGLASFLTSYNVRFYSFVCHLSPLSILRKSRDNNLYRLLASSVCVLSIPCFLFYGNGLLFPVDYSLLKILDTILGQYIPIVLLPYTTGACLKN